MSIPVLFFPTVGGSMTSPDGQVFLLRVRREDGQELLLGFPHPAISDIVECAAMQTDHGRDKDGDKVAAAFQASSFELGKGPKGETVLSLVVGAGGKISFILPDDMMSRLFDSMAKIVMPF